MKWAMLLACCTLAAQVRLEFARDEPKGAMLLGYRDGRLLWGRGVEDPGPAMMRLVVEDREGKSLRDYDLKPEAGKAGRIRLTTAALTAEGDVAAGLVAMESPRRMENLMLLGGEEHPVSTGTFSCMVVAAAVRDQAWCLGFSMGRAEAGNERRHLFYRVGADGKATAFYPLPAGTDQRTAEGLSRFPALGLPSLWANADGSVWAWLPGDRKLARFRESTGRLEVWDVPVPKGGAAGVTLTVSSGGRAIALLPVSQDGVRVAPGPSPVFAAFELSFDTGRWERMERLPAFRRGARLVGSDAGAVVVSNRETGRLEWYGVW